MSVVDGTGTRVVNATADSRGLDISSVCGKVVPKAELRASDGMARSVTEPEGHGAMVDMGPDVKMK